MGLTRGDEERLKLTANFANILAAGTVVTGGISPIVGTILGSLDAGYLFAAVGSFICVTLGIILHLAGRSLLKRIDQ